jgi:hypothetical protein
MPIDSVSSSSSSAVLMLEREDAIALELGGDVDAELGAMLLKQADQSREMTHQARDAVEKHLSAVEDEQVARLRDKAAETRRAAETEGWATMAGGAATAYGGVAGLADASEAIKSTCQVAKGGGGNLRWSEQARLSLAHLRGCRGRRRCRRCRTPGGRGQARARAAECRGTGRSRAQPDRLEHAGRNQPFPGCGVSGGAAGASVAVD